MSIFKWMEQSLSNEAPKQPISESVIALSKSMMEIEDWEETHYYVCFTTFFDLKHKVYNLKVSFKEERGTDKYTGMYEKKLSVAEDWMTEDEANLILRTYLRRRDVIKAEEDRKKRERDAVTRQKFMVLANPAN